MFMYYINGLTLDVFDVRSFVTSLNSLIPNQFMKFKLTFLFALCALFYTSNPPQSQAQSRSSNTSLDDYESRIESPAREAAYRAALSRVENLHKQHLQRATETVALSLEVRQGYGQRRTLTPELIKKLERLEKLARRVRDYAGGSDDNDGKINITDSVSESLDKISTLAQKIQRDVEVTSRRIVSAKIINTSTELIALAEHVQLQFKK